MTEKIGIVVDSTADFPPGMVEELGPHARRKKKLDDIVRKV